MNAGTAHAVRQSGADVGGRAVQEVGLALGLGVEVEELLDGGTQVEVAGTLLVQERAALRRVQVGRLLEQRFHGFGGWLGHVPTVLGLAEPLHEPRPDVAPVPVERALGQPEDRRGLVHRQAGEVAQQDDLGLERVARFEFLERLVDREHVVRGRLEDGARLVQLLALPAAALLRPGLAARLFDQDVAHGSRGGEEEVLPAFPGHVAFAGDAQVDLVDQRRRLSGSGPAAAVPAARVRARATRHRPAAGNPLPPVGPRFAPPGAPRRPGNRPRRTSLALEERAVA